MKAIDLLQLDGVTTPLQLTRADLNRFQLKYIDLLQLQGVTTPLPLPSAEIYRSFTTRTCYHSGTTIAGQL